MPRILEALQQEMGRHAPFTRGVAVVPAVPPPVVAAPVAATEEIPFIEVGGAGLEASPVVLACKSRTASGNGKAASPKTTAPAAQAVCLAPPAAPPATPATLSFQPVHDGGAEGPLDRRLVPELITFHQPDHALSGQYRAVLEQLVTTARQCASKVLLLSGAGGGVGTTTVMLNLAIAHAHDSGQRVLVVDAGVHRPAVARKLGLSAVPGLREVLAGLVPLHRALKPTGLPNLDALVLGEESERPSLAVRSLGAALQQLRQRYDVILVDAPAWHGGADMLALASACDALFLVLPRSQADSADSKRLVQAIRRQGVPLRGCVLTQSDESKP